MNLKDIDNIIELATDYINRVKETMEFISKNERRKEGRIR